MMISRAGLPNLHSVHVHMRPHYGGKIWRPHHITKPKKIVIDIYVETDNQHWDCCFKSFSLCILGQLGTERRMVELASPGFGLMVDDGRQ